VSKLAKIAFYTLGCKVNTYDTESVWEVFKEAGYERVSFDETADVYIINTCTVTNQSDSKSRKITRQAVRRNENAVVVVMGCYAQVAAEELALIDGVDIITGTKNRREILRLVEEIVDERVQLNVVSKLTKTFDDLSVKSYRENTRAFLKIQDGCDNFCNYCIIPFARGEVVSKSPEKVIAEAIELVNNGYQELILSGIHTGKYGTDLDYTLTRLVEELIQIDGLHRLRISSIEINEITDRLIELATSSSKLANHFHIPLQSGSDKVLIDMNRQYNKEFFLYRINEIRKVNPDISITTDVIVGYPTETDDLFEETFQFITDVKFNEMHVFPFSKRNGTPAAKLKDLDKQKKSERVKRLLELNNKLANEYVNKFIGKTLDIIVERSNPTTGYTSNYLKVEGSFTAEKNEIVDVTFKDVGYPISSVELTSK